MHNKKIHYPSLWFLWIVMMLAPPTIAQEGIKQLIVRAIEMQGEPVLAELQGEIAHYIQRHTGSLTNIKISAQLIQALVPEGCGRVQIELTQQGLQTLQFPIQMNYCIDGSVPVLGGQH